MAPNTNIFDNDNENSIDPNPYAYPYFHSNESTPLLYHLIVTHFGNASDPLLLNHFQSLITSTSSSTDTDMDSGASSPFTSPSSSSVVVHSEKTISRRIKFIGRRIQSRCKGRPQEAKWVDSCGENALFRFCQLVRFQKEAVTETENHAHEDILDRIEEMDASFASSSSKRKLKLDSTAELTFFILKCLINVDKNALSTLNKWGETPLHQFVGHCGFHYQDAATPTSTTVAAATANGASSTANSNCTASYQDSCRQQNRGLSYHFLELMLRASPNTVHQTNFQRALPLHGACSLGQLNANQPFSALDSMVSMDKLLMPEPDTITSKIHEYPHYAKDHLQIIRRLVEYYPKGVLAIDINGCTPLYRAVDSIHCSADVVSFVLHEMENSFVRTTSRIGGGGCDNFASVCDSDSVKFLFYKAIMGFEVRIVPDHDDDNREKSNWYNGYQHQSSAFETKNEGKKVLSPMEGLWKAVLVRRQVKHSIPNMKDDITCASIADVIDNTLSAINNDIEDKKSILEKANSLTLQLGHTWEKIMHLMCCAFHGSTKVREAGGCQQRNKNSLGVHAGIYCAAPTSILNLLLCLYPDDLLKCDEMGNTPLVLSIISPSYKEQWEDKLDYGNGDGNNNHSDKYQRMKQILEAAPEASRVMNRKGRLPLHIAIDAHWDWNDGVKDIFMANPTASSIRDPDSHLLPFMLASRSGTYSCPMDCLSNAYTLLRADPSVLKLK